MALFHDTLVYLLGRDTKTTFLCWTATGVKEALADAVLRILRYIMRIKFTRVETS